MKNIFTYGLLCFSCVIVSSCSTLKRAPKQTHEDLLQKEIWRNELPHADTTPVKPHFPKVLEKTLSNGLRVFVVEDKRLPIVEIGVAFKNGSALDPIGKAGLQNLTTTMLKEGTTKLTSLELAEAFANLGTEVRMGVGKDLAYISAGVLSNKVKDAFALISSMVQNPRLSEDDFARVKLQQQNSIQSDLGTPNYVAQVRFLMAAYGEKHPYAYPSAGTVQTLGNINLNDVKKSHKLNFGPNNAALVVAGDVTLKQVTNLAERYFGHWKKIKDPFRPVPSPKKSKQMQTILVSRPSMPQTLLLVGQPAATQKDKNLPTYEVFQNILAGMPTSRLGANLRERKGWTYGVHSSLTPLRGLGPLLVSTSVQVPYGADALKEILAEFENMKKNPVTSEELNSAKSGLMNSFASRYSTLKKIASSTWENFIYDLPKDFDEKFYNQIARVTPQDIMDTAKSALAKDRMIAVGVGDLEVMEIPLAKMSVGQVIIDRD